MLTYLHKIEFVEHLLTFYVGIPNFHCDPLNTQVIDT